MRLHDLVLPPSLCGPPVTVSGGPVKNVSACADWIGRAVWVEPIVAVSFVVVGGETEWVKSQPASCELEVRLRIGRYDEAGLDIQVGFGVGGSSRRCRTLLTNRALIRAPAREATLAQGRLQPLARIQGTPVVSCYALFLAGRAVRTGQNRLWNLRPALRSDAPESVRRILAYGRTGRL